MAFSISGTAPWLSVTPDTASSAGPHDRVTVAVQVDASGLGLGQHQARLRIDGTGFRSPPRYVSVTLTVASEAFARSMAPKYDANNNQSIELDEARTAVADYFRGSISLEDVLEIVRLYFAG